jgi:hypothetical protein
MTVSHTTGTHAHQGGRPSDLSKKVTKLRWRKHRITRLPCTSATPAIETHWTTIWPERKQEGREANTKKNVLMKDDEWWMTIKMMVNENWCGQNIKYLQFDVLSPQEVCSKVGRDSQTNVDGIQLGYVSNLGTTQRYCFCSRTDSKKAFTLYTEQFLQTKFSTQRRSEKRLHWFFTQNRFYTKEPSHRTATTHVFFLHTETFVYTGQFWHTDAFTHERLHAKNFPHRTVPTHRSLYTERFLHTQYTNVFTHKRFYAKNSLRKTTLRHKRSLTQRSWPRIGGTDFST